MQAATSPDLFQSWGGGGLAEQVEAGLVKDITADDRALESTINPGALSMYQVDGKQYGVPFDLGHRRLLVQQGAVREGRHHRAARRRGTSSSTDVGQAQGSGHHPDRPRRQGHVAGHALGRTSRSASAGPTSMQQMVKTGNCEHRRLLRRPARSSSKLIDLKPFQKGFLAAA